MITQFQRYDAQNEVDGRWILHENCAPQSLTADPLTNELYWLDNIEANSNGAFGMSC